MANLLDLCSDLPTRSIPEGGTILEENVKDGALLILKSGAVEIVKHGTVVTTLTNPGAMLGEIAVLLDCGHTASAVAIHDCEFYVVEHAEERLDANPKLYREIARTLSRRLMRLSDEMIRLQGRLEAGDERGELNTLAMMWGFE